MKTRENFDPSKKVLLKSYAKFRIRGAILGSLCEMDWSPRHPRPQARRMEEAHRDLKLRLGHVATETELAVALEMKLEAFHHLLGELRGLDVGSLQAESIDHFCEGHRLDPIEEGEPQEPAEIDPYFEDEFLAVCFPRTRTHISPR